MANCEDCKYINMTRVEAEKFFLETKINRSIRCQYYKQNKLLKYFEPFLHGINKIEPHNQCGGKYFKNK